MYGRTDGREWSVLAANDDSIKSKKKKKKRWAIPAPILRFAISVTLRWLSVRPCDRSFVRKRCECYVYYGQNVCQIPNTFKRLTIAINVIHRS